MPQEGFLRCCPTHPGANVHAPKERHRRAEHARRAYFIRLALASAKACRTKSAGGAGA